MSQTINLGKLRLDWRGDYNPSTPNVVNDVVTYRGQQWVCTQPTQAAQFTGSQLTNQLTVTALTPITGNVNVVSTAAGTTVTVSSTAGLVTGNQIVISGNSGGGLTSGSTYFVGSITSSTTMTLATSYANAISGSYITFTANTFGSQSSGTIAQSGTSFVAYGSIAVGQVIANSTSPITITNATGTGAIATLTFATQPSAPYAVGSSITVQGVTPLGYNGIYVVTACNSTSVSFANITTLTMQPGSAGTVSSVTNAVTITAGVNNNGTGVYTVSNSVSSSTGSISWTTVAASTPTPGSAYWTQFTQLFNNNATWTNGQSYAVGDVVVYATPASLLSVPSSIAGNYTLSRTVTQAYYCTAAHTANNNAGNGTVITPIDSGFWTPVNRKGALGTQLSPQSLYGTYNLGVYSNQNNSTLVLPNRGIAFDNSPNYYNGATKNTTDSPTGGYVAANGQAMSWGADINGSVGLPQAGQATSGTATWAMNSLTFPFYDYWRSGSITGQTGVHATPDGGMPRIIQWEKSYDRNVVLMNSGEVFCWGGGSNGENGNGATANVAYPVRAGGTLTSIYNNTSPTGTSYTNGTIYTAGHAFFNVRIKRISTSGGCGYGASNGHTLALDENGQLWVWGSNTNGQLGVGYITGTNNTTNYSIPVQIPKLAFATASLPTGQSVVGIWACGAGTNGWSYAVTQDGNLWAWGVNGAGQLGTGNTSTQYQPLLINNVAGSGLTFGGGGVGSVVKIQVLDNGGASTNACAAILTSTGQLYCAGSNASYWAGSTTASLTFWTVVGGGPGTASNSICKDMWLYGSGGSYASLMQRDATTGFCWTSGYNLYGQLGLSGTSVTANNSTVTISKMNVAGSIYNLINVKQLAFSAYGNVCVATVVLDNGMSFSIGNNYYGAASIGYSNSNGLGGTAGYTGAQTTGFTAPAISGTFATEANAIELVNSYVWQPLRTPPGMQGNMADAMGFGYSSANYQWLMWLNKDGRVMVAGNGGDGTVRANLAGQYHIAYDGNGTNIETMTTPITD